MRRTKIRNTGPSSRASASTAKWWIAGLTVVGCVIVPLLVHRLAEEDWEDAQMRIQREWQDQRRRDEQRFGGVSPPLQDPDARR